MPGLDDFGRQFFDHVLGRAGDVLGDLGSVLRGGFGGGPAGTLLGGGAATGRGGLEALTARLPGIGVQGNTAFGGVYGLSAPSAGRTVAKLPGIGTPAPRGGGLGPTSLRAGAEGDSEEWTFPVQDYKGKVALHHGSHAGGSDIFANPGTPVVAARGGQVTGAGYDPTGGNYVSIRGSDGLDYYYAHLDRTPAVAAGQSIGPGTYLGGVGDTGNAKGTGAHLHFGAGRGIQTGVGAAGGAGIDYDAVAQLQRALRAQLTPQGVVPSSLPAGQYQQLAAELAVNAGIDPGLFVRQIQQESGFQTGRTSPAGARGIAQIVPQYHPGVNPDNPEEALRYAANLMARNIQQYGSARNALIAYNAGPGGLQRYQRTGVLPAETQLYLRRVLGE